MKKILIGLPIFVICGCVICGLYVYLNYLYSTAKEDRWEKLPSPPEKIATIEGFYRFSEVLVKTEAGNLYMCSRNACLPCDIWKKDEDGYENYSHDPCDDTVIMNMDYPPRGKIIDSCIMTSADIGATVVLLEDYTLWYRSVFAGYTGSFFTILGIVVGGAIGFLVWIPWAIWMIIRARRRTHQPDRDLQQ